MICFKIYDHNHNNCTRYRWLPWSQSLHSHCHYKQYFCSSWTCGHVSVWCYWTYLTTAGTYVIIRRASSFFSIAFSNVATSAAVICCTADERLRAALGRGGASISTNISSFSLSSIVIMKVKWRNIYSYSIHRILQHQSHFRTPSYTLSAQSQPTLHSLFITVIFSNRVCEKQLPKVPENRKQKTEILFAKTQRTQRPKVTNSSCW